MTLPFTMHAHRDGPEATLVMSGELDVAAAPLVADAVIGLCRDGTSRLLIDIEGVSFMDSTGLRSLLASRDMCESHECELRLTRGTEQVQRLFELTRLVDRLSFLDGSPKPNGQPAPSPAGVAIEQTLLEHGDEALVRQVRLRFQENMDESFTGVVERATGREVRAYQSQVLFDPEYSIEMFLLGAPLAAGGD